HIVKALRFELGKVETTAIRMRMLGLLSQVDVDLADKVAAGLGLKVPAEPELPMNHGVGADADPAKYEPKTVVQSVDSSTALSMLKNPTNSPTIASRKVAFVCADGVSEASVMNMKSALLKNDAKACIIAPHMGFIATQEGGEIPVEFTYLTASSVLFDAVYVPGGLGLQTLSGDCDVVEFLNDAYKHCKVIGADGEGIDLMAVTNFASNNENVKDEGIVFGETAADPSFAQEFVAAMGQHRFWERENTIYKTI
ncbi:MAG: catalase HPII, partial [Proteobacteria bacterium]